MLKNNNSRFVGLRATADGSLLRTATLYEKEYIVVPIVSAVGDEVWWPANSDTPELVPADVLESAYWSRNNRPIVLGHPRVNGEYVSANSPGIIESYAFGFTFASKFEDKRVKVEAWFDPIRANEVGPSAEKVIERLKNGEMIEVSEGNMVISESKEGELGGKKYYSVWLSAINDHLAVVSEGACNNQMGCGGPRVNEQKKHSVTGLSIASNKGASVMKDSDKKSFFSRLFGSAMTAFKSAMSNNELRLKLYKAVEQVDQGVMYVDDEDVEAKTFRYCVVIRYGDYWDYEQMEHHYYQRSFSVDDSGNVAIGDDRTEVEWFEGWREKVDSEKEKTEVELTASETNKPCSCQDEKEVPLVNANEKKALVSKLIGAAKSPFDESDRAMLEGMKEEKLTALMSAYKEGEAQTTITTPAAPVVPVNPPANQTETSTPPPGMSLVSDDELNDIKAAASAYRSQQEAFKTSLISSLKSAQTAFTEDDLKKMDISTLEKLATSLNVNEPATADYSVRGANRPNILIDDKKDHTPPKSWEIALSEKNKRNQVAN